jgi:N-acetylmuramoyl-L-alanine amidase
MQRRKRLIDEANPDCVVSIHMNSFPSHPNARGAQVFFYKTGEQSRALANLVQNNLNAANKIHAGKNLAALSGKYYILEKIAQPSVIVECGFFSNPEDEKLLVDEEYQKLICSLIAKGVLEFVALPQGSRQDVKSA